MKKWFILLLLPLQLLGNETLVESNVAYYNGRVITLIGDVIVENAMGRVEAEKAILIRDETKETTVDFPWIELSEAVSLTLPNGGHLTCEKVSLDYTQMTSRFTGEVLYSDERGEVSAEEAIVDYVDDKGSLQPTKVTLFQNVRLTKAPQYALADLLTYYPDEELMILEGKTSRVLFFDKERNMQLSAPLVRAKRKEGTKSESIQGVGDVRFIFAQEELSKLKEYFQW